MLLRMATQSMFPRSMGTLVRTCPVVYRWPYDYSVPGAKEDYIPQHVPPSEVPAAKVEKT